MQSPERGPYTRPYGADSSVVQVLVCLRDMVAAAAAVKPQPKEAVLYMVGRAEDVEVSSTAPTSHKMVVKVEQVSVSEEAVAQVERSVKMEDMVQ